MKERTKKTAQEAVFFCFMHTIPALKETKPHKDHNAVQHIIETIEQNPSKQQAPISDTKRSIKPSGDNKTDHNPASTEQHGHYINANNRNLCLTERPLRCTWDSCVKPISADRPNSP